MVAVDTSEIKNGLTIELDGEPYKVLNFSIMKQARGAAKTTIKMKNLKRGNTIENTYRSGEKFETAEILRKPSQYTYEDDVSVFVHDIFICAVLFAVMSNASFGKCRLRILRCTVKLLVSFVAS